MKRRFKTAFLFDMRGFWADERVDGNIWNLKNPIYRWVYHFFKRQELLFLNEADYTVSLTLSGKNEMLTWKGITGLKERVKVIPCCADLNLFKPVSRDSEEFTLGYLGSLGTWYMLTEMLMVFKKIKNEIPTAKFHFFTPVESTCQDRSAAVGRHEVLNKQVHHPTHIPVTVLPQYMFGPNLCEMRLGNIQL